MLEESPGRRLALHFYQTGVLKMKKLIVCLIVMMAASSGMAAEWTFKFTHKGDEFKTALTAPTYDQAFELAAKSCFRFFQNNQKMTDELGDKLISICANPKAS